MNKINLLAGLLILAAIVLLVFVLVGPGTSPLSQRPISAEKSKPDQARGVDLPKASEVVSSAPLPTGAGTSDSSPTAVADVRPEADREAEREAKEEAIWDAAYTFSPESLKVLAPFLNDPDPAIREAAIEGIEQLASPEGIAVLQSAVPRARNEKERRRLMEAVEWLALPEWRGQR